MKEVGVTRLSLGEVKRLLEVQTIPGKLWQADFLIVTLQFQPYLDREYGMDYEVKNVKMKDEFKVCPSCGYEDGFHSMFKQEEDTAKWLFICPTCHMVFDIGFTVSSN
jgi:hypothetical protein